MKKSILSIAFILFVLAVTSCKKENGYLVSDAIIKNTGLEAADGCGWMIQTVSGEFYKAENLPENFQVDNKQVHVTYTLTGKKYQCGMLPASQNPGNPIINIHTIEKQ